MKNLLQLLGNLCSWFNLSLFSFWGILWYGKLPKVSMYHWTIRQSLYTTKGIYNDINHQIVSTNDVPTKIKHKIIEDYIDALRNDGIFKANVNPIDIPLFDGKEVYGTRGIYSLLTDIKEKQL